jgi:menaquinone-dependent protoporphyrinogen oxidase
VRVLVAYASAHGSTAGVAERVGERLRGAGLDIDVQAVEQVRSLDAFDAFVIGSAIHDRAWLASARAFVEGNLGELARSPVFLFSVSSVGATNSFFGPRVARVLRAAGREPKDVTHFRTAIRPRGHRSFAGAVERDHWNLAGHLFLVLLGGTYGDHRDWADIDAWADGIARELSISRAAAEDGPDVV